MPTGTCDPASRGQTWNEAELAMFNAAVTVAYRYGWDGVSTKASGGCVGPLNRLQAINHSATVTYYAWFLSRKNVPRMIAMPPGFNQIYNATQLHNAGFDTNEDVADLDFTESPVSPF